MRAANPKATVRVVWLNTWFDPPRERDAAQTLIDQGADVLTNHSASPAVAQAAQANFRDARRARRLATRATCARSRPTRSWPAIDPPLGRLLHRASRARARRQLERPKPVWGGIASGMVELGALDPTLPASVRAGVQTRRARRSSTAACARSPRRWSTTPGRCGSAHGALDDAVDPAHGLARRRRRRQRAESRDALRPARTPSAMPRRAGRRPGRTHTRPCRGCRASRCRAGAAARSSRPPAPAATYHGSRCSSVGCMSTACGAWLR